MKKKIIILLSGLALVLVVVAAQRNFSETYPTRFLSGLALAPQTTMPDTTTLATNSFAIVNSNGVAVWTYWSSNGVLYASQYPSGAWDVK